MWNGGEMKLKSDLVKDKEITRVCKKRNHLGLNEFFSAYVAFN